MDERGEIRKGGDNMGNRVRYKMCKENVSTLVEKISVNGRKIVGSGGENID